MLYGSSYKSDVVRNMISFTVSNGEIGRITSSISSLEIPKSRMAINRASSSGMLMASSE